MSAQVRYSFGLNRLMAPAFMTVRWMGAGATMARSKLRFDWNVPKAGCGVART